MLNALNLFVEGIIVRLKTNLFEVQIYLYLLVKKIVSKCHVACFLILLLLYYSNKVELFEK